MRALKSAKIYFSRKSKLAAGSNKHNLVNILEVEVGRILNVTNSNHNISGMRKKTVSREIVIGPTAIKFIAISIFAVLAVVYLAQSTAGANRSIKIRDFEGKKGDLMLEKERLEVEQTRLKSLKEIESGIDKNNMEPIGNVEHLNDAVVN